MGGVNSGYWAIGSWVIEMTPMITMKIDITIATMGLLTKNSAMVLMVLD